MGTVQLSMFDDEMPPPTFNAESRLDGLSQHTKRAYNRWLQEYLGWCQQIPAGQVDLTRLVESECRAQLKPGKLEQWLRHLKDGKGLGGGSISQARASVYWLGNLVDELTQRKSHVHESLARAERIKAPKGQRPGQWLRAKDVARILTAVSEYPGASKRRRDLALLSILIVCGIRRNEVACLKWGDLRQDGIHWLLHVDTAKGNRPYVVKVPDWIMQYIEDWRDHSHIYSADAIMFPRIWKGGALGSDASMSDRAIWVIVCDAVRKSGIGKRIAPHDLRRTFAAGALAADASFEQVQDALGHVRGSPTTQTYTNVAMPRDPKIDWGDTAFDAWSDEVKAYIKE